MQCAWLGLAVLLISKAASADMGPVSCPEPTKLPCSSHCTHFGYQQTWSFPFWIPLELEQIKMENPVVLNKCTGHQ
jgi:hypothetical protein